MPRTVFSAFFGVDFVVVVVVVVFIFFWFFRMKASDAVILVSSTANFGLVLFRTSNFSINFV